jgi:hypothetical protein
VNVLLEKVGREKISLSKRVKDSVKAAVKFISDFEHTAGDIAIQNDYQYVICGHIHEPAMRAYSNDHGSVLYLNSGDWIENLTALEFNDKWSLVHYKDLGLEGESADDTIIRKLSPDIIAMQDAFEKHKQIAERVALEKTKLSA